MIKTYAITSETKTARGVSVKRIPGAEPTGDVVHFGVSSVGFYL